MKIAVYAIAKNEAKHAQRWYDSMKEADGVFVLDTGSTDGTQEILRSLGVTVRGTIFEPFHFGEARNASLDMVPEEYDVLVCTDLDEVFSKGWASEVRAALEAVPDANVGACRFITKFDSNGVPESEMHFWKIHRRCACGRWKARVHEYLDYPKKQKEVFIEGIVLEHHPDSSKSRGQYLEMLRLEREENPDPRSIHYYGRELMFHKKYDEAIEQFKQYLEHPDAKWKDERAWSMRYIGRCYAWKGNHDVAAAWLWRATAESTWQRESVCDLAEMYLTDKMWEACALACRVALERNYRNRHYFTEDKYWGVSPHDMLAVSLFNMGDMKGALKHSMIAVGMAPKDERIVRNHNLILEKAGKEEAVNVV